MMEDRKDIVRGASVEDVDDAARIIHFSAGC
jgi:hypothetical protein